MYIYGQVREVTAARDEQTRARQHAEAERMTRAGNVWVCGCMGGVWVGVGVCVVCACACVYGPFVFIAMQVHSYVFGNHL